MRLVYEATYLRKGTRVELDDRVVTLSDDLREQVFLCYPECRKLIRISNRNELGLGSQPLRPGSFTYCKPVPDGVTLPNADATTVLFRPSQLPLSAGVIYAWDGGGGQYKCVVSAQDANRHQFYEDHTLPYPRGIA